MGIKPWHRLSLLVVAGAVLTGCTSTNPRDPRYIESKGPPTSPQANQKPATFPTANGPATFPTANGNVNANGFNTPFQPMPPSNNGTLVNQQKPTTFTPTNTQVTQPFGTGPQPQVPGNPLAPNPNPGVPTQSNSFAPPQIPAFQPLPTNGNVQLPGPNHTSQIQGRTEFFGNPQTESRPPVPPPGNFGR
jgi:hypothetical protein